MSVSYMLSGLLGSAATPIVTTALFVRYRPRFVGGVVHDGLGCCFGTRARAARGDASPRYLVYGTRQCRHGEPFMKA